MKERRVYVAPSVVLFTEEDLAAAESEAYMSPGPPPRCIAESMIPNPF